MTHISIADIAIDAGTQVREAINEQVVNDYAEQMNEGVQFPAVIVFHDGNKYYLADGFHRVMAHGRIGREDVAAEVRAGTREDALWFALGANKANGQRLSAGDKKHAILLALKTWPDRSPVDIAVQVGCTGQYVRDIRHQVQTTLNLPDRVIGKDGKSYPSSRANKSMPQERRHPKHDDVVTLLRESVPVHDIAKAVRVAPETIAKIRRSEGLEFVDKSRQAIESRRDTMRKMADEGYTSRQIAEAVGLSLEGCRNSLRDAGITVHADSVAGGTKRHDSTRIVEHIVMDAENLTADVNLIDFSSLDRAHVAAWVDSLQTSRKKLGAFIQRLLKETKHEAA